MVDIIVKPSYSNGDYITLFKHDSMTLEPKAVSVKSILQGGTVKLNAQAQVQDFTLQSGTLTGSGDYTIVNNFTMTGGRFETVDKMFFYNNIEISGGTVVTPGYYQTSRPIFFFDQNTHLSISGGTVYLPAGKPASWSTSKTLPITLQTPAVLVLDSHDLVNYNFSVADGQGFCINFTDLNNNSNTIKNVENSDHGITITYSDGSNITVNGTFPPVSWSTDGISNTLEIFAGTLDYQIVAWDSKMDGVTLYKGDKVTIENGGRSGDRQGVTLDGGTIQLNTGSYLLDATINSGLIFNAQDGAQVDNLTINGGKFEVGNDLFFSGKTVINGGKVVAKVYDGAQHPTFRFDQNSSFVITGGEVLLPAGRPINGYTGKLKIDLKGSAHFQAYSEDMSNYYFSIDPSAGFSIDLIDLKNGSATVKTIESVYGGITIKMNDGSEKQIFGSFGIFDWDANGKDGSIEIFRGQTENVFAGSDTGSDRILSSGDDMTLMPKASGVNNTLVGGKISMNTGAYLSHTTVDSGEITMCGGPATIDWLTLKGGSVKIVSGSSLYGQIIVTGGTMDFSQPRSVTRPTFNYDASTQFTIVGGTVTLAAPEPSSADAGRLRISLRAPATLRVVSADLDKYNFDLPDGTFRIDLIDREASASTINSITHESDGLLVQFADGTSEKFYGNFPDHVRWQVGDDNKFELVGGTINVIVWNKGDMSGSNLVLKSGDKVTFMSGTGGSFNTINGGEVQLNTSVVFSHNTMTSGKIYSSGDAPIIDTFTMSGGEFDVRNGTNLYGQISINGGKVDTFGYGRGSDPVFYYDQHTRLIVSGGEVLLPIPKPVNAETGWLNVELSPEAKFEVYSDALQNLYFKTNGGDFKIDIIDLKFWGTKIVQSMRSHSGFMLILGDGRMITLNGDFSGLEWRADGRDGSIEFYACFAEGTLITTPEGKRPIETLKVGDAVTTTSGIEAITWIGNKTINLHGPVEDECLLIRIKRGAFEDFPTRDVWLTPEHCVFVNGGLVPIRCLVNGESIDYDRSRRHYTYYHFTLAAHDIVFAEDLPSESYRPSKELQRFDTSAPSVHATKADSDIPYHTSPEAIKSAWSAVAAQSTTRLTPGCDAIDKFEAVSRHVQIFTDTGEAASFVEQAGSRARFAIPSGAKYIIIESEASRPDRDLGAYIDDRRQLGVRVGTVLLKREGALSTINRHLSSESIPGWNNVEDGRSRWTSGRGHIPLKAYGRHSKRLEIEVEFPDFATLLFDSEHSEKV